MPVEIIGTAGTSAMLDSSAKWMIVIGIGVYTLLMIAIGLWSSRRIKGLSDFIVAGRRLPMWLATMALLASWFGAGSSMGIAAEVYSGGLFSVIADPFAASLCLIVAGVFLVGLLRRLKCLTITDIIEQRFGKAAGIYASLWMIPIYIGWLGSLLIALGTAVKFLTGMNNLYATLIGAAIVLAYTFAGGMWGVALTNIVQVFLVVLGLCLIIPGAVHEAGGYNAIMNSLSSADLSIAVRGSAEGLAPGFHDWMFYLGSWVIMGLGCIVGQDLVQRSLSSRNEKIAVSSAVVSGFMYMTLCLIPIIIGFAARIVFTKYGVPAEDSGNQVLLRMAMIVFGNGSPIILTLWLAALVSVIMSSADSAILAGASLLCKNVIAPLFPDTSEKRMLMITRLSTILLTAAALVLAIYIESIYTLMKNSWASQAVVVFVPVVAALYFKRAGKFSIWTCMGVATVVWVGFVIIASWQSPEIRGAGSFANMLNTDEFDRIYTIGVMYGFAAAALTFILAHGAELLLQGRTATEKLMSNLRPYRFSKLAVGSSVFVFFFILAAWALIFGFETKTSAEFSGNILFRIELFTGFIYAVIGGVLTFLCCWLGEAIPFWLLGKEKE